MLVKPVVRVIHRTGQDIELSLDVGIEPNLRNDGFALDVVLQHACHVKVVADVLAVADERGAVDVLSVLSGNGNR